PKGPSCLAWRCSPSPWPPLSVRSRRAQSPFLTIPTTPGPGADRGARDVDSDPGSYGALTQSAYGPVLEHPVAKRLLTVQAISEAGDFVGLSALLVLSYTRTGSVLGPAGVYAARTLPSLAVGTVFSGWLDRPPRRAALVTLALGGALVVGTAAVFPTVAAALAVAAVLGALRTASVSITTATVAETVETSIHRPFFALANTINQMAQVIGILTGAGVTLAVGATSALGFDAATFAAAAALLAGLPPVLKIGRASCRERAEG